MRTVFRYLLVLFFAALPIAGAQAEDAVLNVTPGNYQIKRETSSSESPDAIVNNEDRCISEKVFNPVSVLPQNRGCIASNVRKSGNTVSFDINCAGGGDMPPLTGKADYSSNGMAIGWNIVFTGEVDGKPWTIVNKAEGKRTGDCK